MNIVFYSILESNDEKVTKKICEENKSIEEKSFLSGLNKSQSMEHLRAIEIGQVKFISQDRFSKRSDATSKLVLNAKAREIQINLSKHGKYVSWAEVVYELLEAYQCEHIGELGLSQADNLEVISELIRVQKRIDNIIISSEIKVPFVCFLDLEQFIVNDYNHNAIRFNLQKIRDFDDLYVGPLIQNQIVRRIFQIPDNVNDKDQLKLITGSELLKYLVTYLRDNDLWSVKVKPNEFEDYLVKKLKVQRIQDLGVKIINLGIIIGSLKTVQHLYSENLKNVKLELETEIGSYYKNEKIYLLKKLENFSSNERYLNTDSVQVVCDLLKLFENLLDKNEYYYINDFLGLIKESSYLRDCFQLAIALGKHDINQIISETEDRICDPDCKDFYHKYKNLLRRIFCLIVDKNCKKTSEIKKVFNKFFRDKGLKIVDSGHKKFTESESEPDDQTENLQSKLEEFLVKKFEKNSTITLNHLKKIESYLYNNGKRNFCDLLYQNKSLFERLELKLNLNECQSKVEPRLFDKDEIYSYIDQIRHGLEPNTFDKCIEQLLLRRYSISDIQELVLGNLTEILKESENKAEEFVISIDSIFEPNISEKIEIDDLIKKVISCPFLTNLYSYLNWSEQSIYYGKFTDFIKRINKKSIQIKTLELNDKIYLKLDPDCSIELLKESIETLDPQQSASNLISLICLRYKSMFHSPKSLISNEIQSSMATVNDKNKLYNYIIEFICKIPEVCLTHVIFKFILEPLIRIDSDHQVAKKIFHLVIENYSSDRIDWFIRLGDQLSILDWSKSSLENFKNLSEKNDKNFGDTNKIEFVEKNEFVEEKIVIDVPFEFESIQSNQIRQDDYLLNVTNEFGHISLIRKRYGIGLDLNQESRSVTESLTGVIGRSLQSLSSELYNKDMHFVLELIQNADDNLYPEHVSPTLVFLIENNFITLFNNEKGFSSKNISAICDVKASTKGAHHKGYIGRKGIGFKSVFTVTDRPEIHSNNYHIKFDLSNGHIGYILPEWLNDYEISLNKQKNYINSILDEKDFNTCIRLPLKSESEMQRHKSSLLTNNFNDIKPNLLLFLNRLRKLAIINRNGKNRIYERIDKDQNLVEIVSGEDKCHKWFVIRDVIDVPESIRPADCVKSTELCLAFPLDDLENLEKMDVFAYLPLRSFGFKFIIQADFVVPASRQDINQDNEWNQWLAKQIPFLFIKCLEKLKNHKFFHQDPLFYLSTFLKFVPLENEILGFFQHVPKQIFDLLKNENFLPIETESNSLVFKKPFECVITDDCIREILSSDMLKKYSGRYFLSKNLNSVDKKLFFKLGVQYLGINELLEFLEQVFTETITDTKTIAKWLLVFQHCLNGSFSIQQEDKFIKKLTQFEIIPVIKHYQGKIINQFVSLDKYNVFFNEPNNLQIPDALQNDLIYLNQEKIFCLDTEKNNLVKQFLKNLGVKNLDLYQIVENHIMLNLSQPSLTKSDDVLISYMIFLYKSCSSIGLNFEIMARNLPIKTNKGFRKLSESPIFLTKLYGGTFDLRNLLPSFEWTLIDEVYFKLSSDGSKKNEIKWKKFLTNLGLIESFVPIEICLNIGNGSLIKDHKCEVIDFYLNLAKKSDEPKPFLKEELGNLCKILQETWDMNYSSFKFSNLLIKDTEFDSCKLESSRYTESNFFQKLKETKWIPAELGNKVELMAPSSIYLKDQIIKGLYANNVAYSITSLDEKSNFCKDLGFKCEFNIDDFLSEFKRWISSGNKFKASFVQMKNIYCLFSNCLNSLSNCTNVRQLLEKKFIFVPDEVEDDEEKPVSGYFYQNNQVYCSDATNIFDLYKFEKSPIFLDKFYSRSKKLIEIFINDFKIDLNPGVSNYIELLSHISLLSLTNKTNFKYEQTLCHVFKVFEFLAQLNDANLIDYFRENDILPCFKNKWVSLRQNPVIVNNDFEIAQKLANKIPILISKTPENNENELINLCGDATLINFYSHFLKVETFSSLICLEMENVTTCLSQNETISSICNQIMPFIQSFIYNREEFKDFVTNQGQVLRSRLSSLNFFAVKNLENVYRFKNNPKICVSLSNKTYLDLNSSIFYVRSDCLDSLKDIVKGFIKGITQGHINDKVERELVNFCLLMYQFSNKNLKAEDKKEIEKDFGVKLSLPEKIPKWSLDGTKSSPKILPSTSGQSQKQNMFDLNKLSSNQMNLTGKEEFSVSDLSIQNIDLNLDQLQKKMKENFCIKSLNEIEKTPRSELSSIDMVIPGLNFSKKGLEFMAKIGRLGELWVNEMLKHKFKDDIQTGRIQIEWANQEFESGLPYDFKIKHFGNEQDGFGDSERFIEVKSTTKMNQEYFPISINEILFAQKYGSKFEIYRLYNVNTNDPNNVKLKVVRNLPQLLNSHGINLFIVI